MKNTAQTENPVPALPTVESVQQLVTATRSCRRFAEHAPISTQKLHQLVEMARLSGSSRNGQPWQYMVIHEPQLCAQIFPHLAWAGFLPDWKGPVPGERPAAYILCLLNQDWLNVPEKLAFFDLGIASQSLLLGAAAMQLMGCRIGAFSRKIENIFVIPDHLKLELVIALGEPVEQVVLEEMVQDEAIAYWRDEQQVHHVPKRSLQDLLVTLQTR